MKVTEHEMRGLLTGKCVPADMLVNEELPAYLVRKFADLHSDIKKQETAYAQAVDSILMALKDKELIQDRLEDTEDKLQESREKLDAVLAEHPDARRMDWLVSKCVEVRQPLRYGSAAMFRSHAITDEEDEHYATKLREQIDNAILSEGATND